MKGTPGFGATLRDGEESLLCDFADAEAMERALLTLLQDEPLRMRIARNAWDRVRLLIWDTNIAKLDALYTGWAAEHRQHLGSVADRKSGVLPLQA
ncbi:MAG: hypothetical protein QOG23_3537 [Blastocatellia bacterium]|jgi:glycosyltransferase involved in cell wall biosynthesis|nr:hypothetical protein [Blastocatellia bacterium]